MVAAGFYPIENTEIRFGRDGNWYADGQVVANRRIADLFSRHVQRRPEGGYMLRIADEQAAIIVEDTPYVVIAVAPDGEGKLRLELNDHSREGLDPRTLQIGSEDVLYCRVKSGTESARFLRPAYYQLTEHCAVTADGRVVLRLSSGDYPLARRR